MKNRVLLIAVAMGASSASFAADISKTVNPMTEATKIMERCTAIAKRISAMPVPAGHSEARAAEHYNQSIAKAAPAAAGQPAAAAAEPMKIGPEHQAFMNNIRAARDELEKCGMEFQKVNKTTDALVKKTGDELEKDAAKNPTEDHKKIGAAMAAYIKADDDLEKAIESLSKDKIHERYLGRSINKYFLGRD